MRLSISIISLFLVVLPLSVQAQPKLEFQIKKPEKFQERKLGSEKSADKKWTFPRKVMQNTITHYNYYFNANEKLKQIVDNATIANGDDYTELLTYYPYTLEGTRNSPDLDSVLQTTTAGILLHDLRNSYIDDLYLLMGRAWLLRGDFDSAAMAFQYINTSYAPKEEGGYDIPIGSNISEGGNAFSISTKEKTGITQKLLSRPPSRNESFLWMARTMVERGDVLDAASLIQTLKQDPIFPDRLKEELNDITGYMHYRDEQWDSAAVYLEKAIPLRSGDEEKARAWFLAGQLYRLANNFDLATTAFEKSSKMAVDPVMDIYARLYAIQMRKSDDPGIIDRNIAELQSMAKKDRYYNYRDIIYYAAALFEAERDGFEPAEAFLRKSIAYNNNKPDQRSRSWKLLGDVYYKGKKYGGSAEPYDSVTASLLRAEDSLMVETRRPGTKAIYVAEQSINLQDSLLRIAAMPEAERNDFVKALAKKLRKERGVKEEPATSGSLPLSGPTTATDELFTLGGNGTWYFYDPVKRVNGKERFLERWGDRPNADNWRRSSSISAAATLRNQAGIGEPGGETAATADAEQYDSSDISYDNLYARLPLSEERKLKVEDRKTQALYDKAVALHEQIEDYPEAIKYYEMVLERRDTGRLAAQSLYALNYLYTKTGNTDLANKAKAVLSQRFAGDSLAQKANKVSPTAAVDARTIAATRTYSDVYDKFISGDFNAALAQKQQADSMYGQNLWSPQLAYIESVYYLKERQDSVATNRLQAIVNTYGEHPIAERAKQILEILPKRLELEDYLTRLEVTRKADEVIIVPSGNQPKQINLPKTVPVTTAQQKAPEVTAKVEERQAVVEVKTEVPSPWAINSKLPHAVVIVLENIDPAYVNETIYSLTNSSQRNYQGNEVSVEKLKIRDKLFLAILRSSSFTNADNAFEYIDYLKPLAEKKILNWLDAKKYRYMIVSDDILEKIKAAGEIAEYEKMLHTTFPSEFK